MVVRPHHVDTVPPTGYDLATEAAATVRPRRRSPSPKSHRTLIPREHGAYAELLFPMVSVLLGGAPTAATWLLALAAMTCFLANEPVLVLVGSRGSRVKRENQKRARQALLIRGIIAVTTGALGLWMALASARIAVALPLLLGTGVAWMAIRGRERSRIGETLAAAALASIALPLGLTAGLSAAAAAAVTALWLLIALLATASVQLIVYQTRAKTEEARGRARLIRALLLAASLGVLVGAALAPSAMGGPRWIVASVTPIALLVTILAIVKPTARRLRAVGWAFVAANLFCLIAVVAALRMSAGS